MQLDKKHKLFLGIIIILLLFVSFMGYEWKKSIDDLKSANDYIASANDTLRHLKNGVVQIPEIQITQEEFKNIVEQRNDLQKQLLSAKIKIKNVSHISDIQTKIELDKPISIPLTRNEEGIDLISDNDCCTDTSNFNCDSLYYSIHGQVSRSVVRFDSINFPDSISHIDYIKTHFFSKDEYGTTVKHSNKYIKTVGLMSFNIKEEKKWWDRRGYFYIAGILSTIIILHK